MTSGGPAALATYLTLHAPLEKSNRTYGRIPLMVNGIMGRFYKQRPEDCPGRRLVRYGEE
jgi:hypothetical protein